MIGKPLGAALKAAECLLVISGNALMAVTNRFNQRSASAEFFVDPVESAVDMFNWDGDAVCGICPLKHAMDVHDHGADSLGFSFDQALMAKLRCRLHGNAPPSITVSVIWTLERLVEMTCVFGRTSEALRPQSTGTYMLTEG